MGLDFFTRAGVARTLYSGPARKYVSSSTTRRSRFNTRCDRRWGSPGIFDVPVALLWGVDPYAVDPYTDIVDDGLMFEEPVLVDLWLGSD
jgi:hypothetical protein